MSDLKPARAQANFVQTHPNIVPGLNTGQTKLKQRSYTDSVQLSRFFYSTDPIANTVVNRIAEIVSTQVLNRRKSLSNNGVLNDKEFYFFNAIAAIIQPYITSLVLSYLIDGMAIPQYEVVRMMGKRLHPELNRTRYYVPQKLWLRDTSTIKLYHTLSGYGRDAIMVIPQEDILFITSGGMRKDGIIDKRAYNELATLMPEYVAAVKRGETNFPMTDYIIFRKLLPFNEYPIPYLSAAIDSFDHKRYIKMMDKAIASRAIEAFRHISVGSDTFPADDEDISAAQTALQQNSSTERVYNFFTNHTIKVEWVTPPLDVLLDPTKYETANADIFFALGFPRILTVGETEKSNSADNKIASLGIMATLLSIQSDIIEWVKVLYMDIADRNGIDRIPEPYFAAIQLADVTSLIQYAKDMIDLRVISRDTAASFYGSSFEKELDQISYEDSADEPITDANNTSVVETPTQQDQSGLQQTPANE